MRVLSGFIVREVAGETIAIPSGDAAKSLSGLLALNESGKLLFELLQSEQTETSLVEALLNEFDIDFATAQADVAEFLEILRSSGVLVESE
ncbi:MAG: PqqD family protein [Eubacteriales bacterium]|nr:PqqD family protein [Eubacteriales bacterium]